jgi:carbon monoxide dehydrogenase subunit G
MPRFAGIYDETFTVDAPIDRAKAHFGDLDQIGKAYPDLERYEKLDDKTLRFTLKPRSALGQTFKGQYDCIYEFTSDNVLAWRTVGQGANVVTVGRIEFSSVGERRTRLVYHERMECDIPINALLAKAIKPIVDRSISGGCKDFCTNMRAGL